METVEKTIKTFRLTAKEIYSYYRSCQEDMQWDCGEYVLNNPSIKQSLELLFTLYTVETPSYALKNEIRKLFQDGESFSLIPDMVDIEKCHDNKTPFILEILNCKGEVSCIVTDDDINY
jgi:hypothetical protein